MKKFRISYNSPVILSFAGISFVVLVLGFLTGGASDRLLFSVYRSSLASLLTYPRFFLHVLGHADYSHYMSNMLLLLVVGPQLESRYGSKPLLLAIVLTAFVSGFMQWLLFPSTALLGASGIVFMLIVMSSLTGVRSGELPLTLILVLVFYLGREVVAGISQNDNVSQFTHIVGGVCGALLGYNMALRRK